MPQKEYTVYGSSSLERLYGETPAHAYQVTVKANDVFDAMGEANRACRRVGVDFKAFKYFEVKEAR